MLKKIALLLRFNKQKIYVLEVFALVLNLHFMSADAELGACDLTL